MRPFSQFKNVHAIRLSLPGFSDLGTANVYLVGTDPVTLIDAAPKFPGSFEYIKEQSHLAGHDIGKIDRILLTHGHVDHFGLVMRIRKEAGHPIPCYIHSEDLSKVTSETYRSDMLSEEGKKLMASVDMPPEQMRKIEARFTMFDYLCDTIEDAIPMEDGDVFHGADYELKVIHTPGHTPGSCCFYETGQKVIFSGDHILQHITPNPLYQVRKGHLRDPHYMSLKLYQQSLDKVSALEVNEVLPGHGEKVKDLPGLVKGYKAHHEERMERIFQALKRESRPLYHIIDDVFEFVPEYDTFLAISEILVHLELLMEAGRVELAESGPPAYYRTI